MNEETLVRMRDCLTHRGPDDAGVWINKSMGLGHRRLSIIDTSQSGHQPMIDEVTGSVIVYNGEVYNFKEIRKELEAMGVAFKSTCDTEVVLKAYRVWGSSCLSHFNGMFAFALYDMPAHRLFIARDRAGQKPLFYHKSQSKFMFASELKALFADKSFPRSLNLKALNFYLAYGYVPGDMCILKDVH
ncbi:MAG: hypothetical protein KAR47_00765 [Planctomycetes bacterium]|nr:hypothetical protein [Planctomycetota bacterium]